MNSHVRFWRWIAPVLAVCLAPRWVPAQPAATQPAKVYVPYEKLKGVFETEKQGVFLPYEEFRRLWRAAQRAPADVVEAPTPYLVSTARFTGTVGAELATMQLELTVDILADGWVEVPIGLGDVAVANVRFAEPAPKPEAAQAPTPLLRVVAGRYALLTRGKGRRVLVVEFVRQLVTQPGLNVLSFRIPASAITTLELTIPEENMKVDVEPMLAASTDQVDQAGKKATRLRAFLGSAEAVKLSWKPKTQAAADLAPVVISDQLQHIHVAEALVSHEITFTYDIRRRGVEAFTVQLPGEFRVTGVEGANIARWDIAAAGKTQNLDVKLFSPAKGTYTLTVKMELFLKEPEARVELSAILTQQVLRRTGLIAITHSPRRSVELADAKGLARVDTGRLPKELRSQPGATAWRFISADYAAALVIATVAPRITAGQLWALGVDSDRLELRGQLSYQIERTGLFQLSLNLPEPWEIVSVGPGSLVDDHQLVGSGRARRLNILLRQEVSGSIKLELAARAPRPAADAPVDFPLPLADAKDLRLYSGQVVLLLADRLRAEVEALQQLQSLPLNRAEKPATMAALSPAMAFEFRSIDPARPAGASFKIAVKPPQVSAVVHRLVNIQPGSVEEQALVDYHVLYAPVDTFYLQMPAALADAGVSINGRDIKEKPRLDALPAAERTEAPATAPARKWAYYKIVLQAPVIGRYRLTVDFRRSFQAAAGGRANRVEVQPILAAGKLSDQVVYAAVAKADTLGIDEPAVKENLIDGDPTSEVDLPEASHRRVAALAFRCNAPPFALVLPVTAKEEAAVFTIIATGAVIEQVLGRDGELNTHATFLLKTSRGDRLSIKLPAGAKLFSVLLNGAEAPVEAGAAAEQKIVRLPPSAGQVAKLVLEVRYGLKGASARNLAAPQLPPGVPIQQTLWRLRFGLEDRLLWFSRVFSPLDDGDDQLRAFAAGYPGRIEFKFPDQGQKQDFVRQGAPGELSVWMVRKETLSIAVWAVILMVGLAAVKLTGYQRCVLILLAALAAAIVALYAPLLVRQVMLRGIWAGLIVLGLWVAHWLFKRLPRHVAERRRKPPAAPPTLAPAGAPPGARPPIPGELAETPEPPPVPGQGRSRGDVREQAPDESPDAQDKE